MKVSLPRRQSSPRDSLHHQSLRRAITLVGVALAAGTAGCAVDQEKEVATYRRELDASSPVAPSYDGDRPLSLVDALALANRNNEQLGLSGEDYLQALIDKNRAVAGFLPTVTFRPSFTLEQTPRNNSLATAAGVSTGSGGDTDTGGTGTGTGSGAGTGNTTGAGSASSNASLSSGASLVSSGFRRFNNESAYQIQAPVVGSMNLFRGGADLATLRATASTAEQRRQLLLDAQATVLLNVAQTYYAVLRAERSVEVLKNNVNVQEARLKDVTQQFANGLATQLSVSQTRAQVDTTRALLIASDGDVRNGRSTLGLLIGADRVAGPLDNNFRTPVTPDETVYEAEALRSRQDLRAAVVAVTAARERVTAAIAQYYPSVTLDVQGFLYREYYSDASKWSSILSVSVPIFSAGLIEADVRTAWSRLRQAALNESYTRRSALTDVRTAYQNLRTSDARVNELRDAVRAASEAYGQSKDAFTANLAINLDVLTAQDQLLSSQLDLAGAEFDRTVYYLDLLRSSGRLTVNEVIAILAGENPATRPSTDPATTQPTTDVAPAAG